MKMHYDVPDTYRPFYTDEIKNQEYSTLPEFEFADALNQYIRKYSLRCDRVETDQKQFSPYDNHVIEYNYTILEAGHIICKIEIEKKIHDTFDEYPRPPLRWPYWSFLSRKVMKECMGPTDVYVLYTGDNYNDIFWASFVKIRTYCKPYGKGYCDTYHRAPIYKQFVSRKLMNLANYIITLQNNEMFSSDDARQKALGDFF
jgi:hypothetical protein